MFYTGNRFNYLIDEGSRDYSTYQELKEARESNENLMLVVTLTCWATGLIWIVLLFIVSPEFRIVVALSAVQYVAYKVAKKVLKD